MLDDDANLLLLVDMINFVKASIVWSCYRIIEYA